MSYLTSERFKIGVAYVLRNEDAKLTGKMTVIPGDSGGRTRFGISENNNEDLAASGFFNENLMTRDQALEVALTRYAQRYWAPMMGDKFLSGQIAVKVFDHVVNGGGIIALQHALDKVFGETLDPDGGMGALTLAAVNKQKAEEFLPAYCQALRDRYEDIIAKHPEDKIDEKGWLARADELPDLDIP